MLPTIIIKAFLLMILDELNYYYYYYCICLVSIWWSEKMSPHKRGPNKKIKIKINTTTTATTTTTTTAAAAG